MKRVVSALGHGLRWPLWAYISICLLSPAAGAETKFGFTPFPYDFTVEAINKTQELVVRNSSIYALHLDQCVPWHEMLDGKPLPTDWQREWKEMAAKIPPDHTRYIAVTPTGTDRETLAPACGAKEGTTRDLPWRLRFADFDDDSVKRAYLAYVLAAVRQFRPDYINIGIEIDGMARSEKKWRQFEHLFDYVRKVLKRQHPQLKVGVEFILQGLMKPEIAQRVKPLVERSDYLGLSFYPYGSSFGEKFGYPPLGPPPDMWRKPLQWVRQYTDKPLALCETGFITRDAELPSYGLHMHGSEQLQRDFTRDLVDITRRDHYLFVIWFLVVDYDRLYAKMPKDASTEAFVLWRNLGFFDKDLRPKPAWKEWLRFRQPLPASRRPPPQRVAAKQALPEQARKRPTTGPRPIAALRFRQPSDLFVGAPGNRIRLDNGSGQGMMRWEFNYQGGWQWCSKEFRAGMATGAKSLRFRIRSDRDGGVLVKLSEQSGESFFALINPGKSWQTMTLDLATLSPDGENPENGQLDPERLSGLMIADGAAGDGASGKRTLWISDLEFY